MTFQRLAKYYDLIYSWKDYKTESELLKKIILNNKKSKGNELLDVACGTGKHLKYLKKWFSCIGIDINEGMLKVARKDVKGVFFKRADMRNFNLKRKFDAIICMFSSLGYTKTYFGLKKTMQNLSNHLKPGGVVVIEPWFTKAAFKKGRSFMRTYDGENLKIARINISKVRGNISILEFHYLVGEENKEVKYFVDKHELGIFEVNKTLKIMKKFGIEAKFLDINSIINSGAVNRRILKRYGLTEKVLKNLRTKERGLYLGIKA